MTADGNVEVSLSLSGFLHDAQRIIVMPGLAHNVELTSWDPNEPDQPPRRVQVAIMVRGSSCPDPSVHALVCDETDADRWGDCDGRVRPYRVHHPVAGKGIGEQVHLCVNHAQRQGSKIRSVRQS